MNKLELICPQCEENLLDVPGETEDGRGFSVLFCQHCDLVWSVKMEDEEWETPTLDWLKDEDETA